MKQVESVGSLLLCVISYIDEGKEGDDFSIVFDHKNPKKRKLKYKEYLQMGNILELYSIKIKIILKDIIKRF